MRTYCLYVLALVAACSHELDITDGVCGNYVLDPGEDCDRPGAACTASCRIACVQMPPCQASGAPLATCPLPYRDSQTAVCTTADALDGTCCPSGMACGVDGVCHSPTGHVLPDQATPFDVLSFTTADVDGDGIDDVLGAGPAGVELRFGATAMALGVQQIVPAPAPTTTGTPISYADIDGDNRIDVVIPTAGGMVAMTTSSGQLAPLASPVEGPLTTGSMFQRAGNVAGVAHVRVAAVNYKYTDATAAIAPVIVELDHDTTGYHLTLVTTPRPPAVSQDPDYVILDQTTDLCSNTLSTDGPPTVMRGHSLHPYVDGATIRVPIASSGSILCVATANPSTGAAYYPVNKSVLSPATGGPYKYANGDGEVFFASYVTAGPCPDLIVPVYDTMNNGFSMVIPGSGSTGTCNVNSAGATFLPGLPLAVITLALTTPTQGLITTNGIYASGGTTPVLAPTRPWSYAEVADLDGDGKQDFATYVNGTENVEVFRQLAGGSTPRFSDSTISTESAVRKIALGNFDGDKSGDVAIATSDNGSVLTPVPWDLTIAYGSADGSFTSVPYATFDEPGDLSSVNLLDESVPPGYDSCDDLLVVRGGTGAGGAADPALLIAEYGATSRTISAPLDYRTAFGQSGPLLPVQGDRVLVGRGQADKSGGLAVFEPDPSSTLRTILALIYNPETQAFDTSTEFVDTSCVTMAPDKLCPDDISTSGIRRDSGDDILFGMRQDVVTGDPVCLLYFVGGNLAGGPGYATCGQIAPEAALSPDGTTMDAFAHLQGVDRLAVLDNDGVTEHVMISGPPAGISGTSFLWTLTVDNGLPHLTNPISINAELADSKILPAGETAGCYAALTAEWGTRTANGITYGAGQNEIVIACSVGTDDKTYTGQLFARYADPNGGPPLYEQIWDTHTRTNFSLRLGDFDGNGLQDLAFTYGAVSAGLRFIHVLLQCDAYQSGCVGGQP